MASEDVPLAVLYAQLDDATSDKEAQLIIQDIKQIMKVRPWLVYGPKVVYTLVNIRWLI